MQFYIYIYIYLYITRNENHTFKALLLEGLAACIEQESTKEGQQPGEALNQRYSSKNKHGSQHHRTDDAPCQDLMQISVSTYANRTYISMH